MRVIYYDGSPWMPRHIGIACIQERHPFPVAKNSVRTLSYQPVSEGEGGGGLNYVCMHALHDCGDSSIWRAPPIGRHSK